MSDATMWVLDHLAQLPASLMTPWAIALALAALTLLLEDAAIAAGILLVGEGAIDLPLALLAVAGGIAGGDMLLYLLGVAARRIPLVRRRLVDACRAQPVRRLLDGHLATAVLIARVVPGLRLGIYTALGLFAAPFLPFALLVAAAVSVWTSLLFWFGSAAGAALARHWGIPVWQVAIAIFLLLTLVPLLARRIASVASGSCR